MPTTPEDSPRIIYFGEYRFDLEHAILYRRDSIFRLPRKRTDVLRMLAERADRIVPKEEIIESVWPDLTVDESNLTLQIFKLRRDLERDPKNPVYILTAPGIGYLLRSEPPPQATPPSNAPHQPLWRGSLRSPQWILIIVLIGIATGLLIGERVWRSRDLPPAAVRRLTSLPGLECEPAISPDGTLLVFSSEGESNSNRDIYLKREGNEQPIRLTDHPDSDGQPTWSPDGARVAFLRSSVTEERKTRLIVLSPLLGSNSVVNEFEIGEVDGGLDWSPDGGYFAITDASPENDGMELKLLSIDGKIRDRITAPVKGKKTSDTNPRFSPDGSQIAFLRIQDDESSLTDLFLVELSVGQASRSIRQLTFDQQRISDLQWMPDGRSIIISSDRDGQRRLWKIPLNGDPPVIVSTITDKVQNFDLSSDGRLLTYTQSMQDTTIEIRPLKGDGQTSSLLPCQINSSATDDTPRFSPDGLQLAFISERTGRNELWFARSDCTSLSMVPTFNSGGGPGSPRWSPDGRMMAIDRHDEKLVNIYLVNLADFTAGRAPTLRQLKSSDHSRFMPAWSHNGEEIYFQSGHSGQLAIWRENLTTGVQSMMTRDGGWEAQESADGRTLFFTRRNHLWRHDLLTGAELELPELASVTIDRYWSVTPQSIYYVPRSFGVRPEIYRYDLQTGQVEKIMELGGFPASFVPGLSVTADERLIAVSYISYRMGDINQATGWNNF